MLPRRAILDRVEGILNALDSAPTVYRSRESALAAENLSDFPIVAVERDTESSEIDSKGFSSAQGRILKRELPIMISALDVTQNGVDALISEVEVAVYRELSLSEDPVSFDWRIESTDEEVSESGGRRVFAAWLKYVFEYRVAEGDPENMV